MSALVGTGLRREPRLGGPPTVPVPAAPLLAGGPSKRLVLPRWLLLVFALLAQAGFAQVMLAAPALGRVQLIAIVGLILWSALKRAHTISICVIAYIPGMEIAFRQSHAPVPYLVSPYLLITIAVLATFTVFGNLTKPGRTALMYLALLIPSVLVTVATTGSNAREPVAFALAGPTSLAVLIVFLSQVRLELWLYRRVLWVFLVSGIAPITIAATSISETLAAAGSIDFNGESNFFTSGGFGPVQVSSVMGLSVVAAVLAVMVERELFARVLAVLLGVLAAGMSFLTFSRGGMTAALIAIAALVVVNPGTKEARRRILTVVGIAVLIGYFLLIPWLNDFTSGGFEKRFSDTNTSRTELARSDLDIFAKHPAFGVGPGMSKYQRLTWEVCQIRADRCVNEGSSHTEFTRMLSEHGISGIIAALFMLMLPFQAYRRAGASRAVTVTFLVWAVAQMFYANFRVSAVAVAFAFAFVQIDLDPTTSDGREPPPEPAPALGTLAVRRQPGLGISQPSASTL